MKATRNQEPRLRIAFSSPQKKISAKEQQRRQELASATECLIAHIESRFRTDVVGIELYPDDSEDLVRVSYWSPRALITAEEQDARQELKSAIETIITDFQRMYRTDVIEIEMYPCSCRVCVAA